MPDITVEGLRLHWEEHDPGGASGSPVVLLHGLGSSSDDWLLQTPALGSRRRILAPDLPGHGRSSRFRGWPSIQAYAAVVRKLLERAEAAPAHLLGLSLGGAVAMQLALDAPRHALSLVAVNGPARFRPRLKVLAGGAVWFSYVVMGRMQRVAEWVADDLFPEPAQARLREEAVVRLGRNRRAGYLQAMTAAARFDIRSRLGRLTCPTLIVAGEADSLIPLEQQRDVAAAIPGARLAVVPHSRHATPIDAAEAFNQIVEKFLDEVESVASGQRPVARGPEGRQPTAVSLQPPARPGPGAEP